MADENALIDNNNRAALLGVTDDAAAELRNFLVDPITGRLKVSAVIASGGDVSGPGSSTNNAIARWDGTGGDTLQDSGVIIDDSDNITVNGSIGVNGAPTNALIQTIESGVGTPDSSWFDNISAQTAGFAEGSNAANLLATADNTADDQPITFLRRSRGSIDTPTAVADGDDVGSVIYSGFDGTNFQNAAEVKAVVDGAVSAGTVPTALELYTGTSTSRTKAIAIDSSQNVEISNGILTADLASGTVDAIGEIASALRTGDDTTLVTGTAGTNGNITQWNADGDLVDSSIAASNILTDSDKTGADAGVVSGTSGTSGNLLEWNADGDAVDSGVATSDVITDSDTASTSVSGIVELATVSETTTGTDATRAVTPDGLAGSDYGIRIIEILVEASDTDLATGDGLNGNFIRIPAELDGYNLVDVGAAVATAGTTGTTDVQIRNATDSVDMLSTKITIDSGETDSSTAATPPSINSSNDDVATGDQIVVDVDAVSTTAPKGLVVTLSFQLP